MTSFLIVHSQPPGGRADLFAQPPTIDVSGLGARLDWGDVTFEVPPGDHRVTISVTPVAGGREGAVVTVRVLPDTGTRISFAPPTAPGQPSSLRVDGQWPADAAMAYYATRDRRELAPFAQRQQQQEPGAAPWGGPQAAQAAPSTFAPPQAQSQSQRPASEPYRHVASPFAPPHAATVAPAQQHPQPHAAPSPTVPPVGPTIGSTGSVPIVQPPSSAPSFGQVQGAVVEPGAQHPHPPAAPPVAPGPVWGQQQQQVPPPIVGAPQRMPPTAPPAGPPAVAPPAFGHGAQQQHPHAGPQHPGPHQPAFGHQPIVRRDVYGRDRADGDRSAPAIPTPRQFEDYARHERERAEAEAVAASRQQQGWYPDPYGRSDVRWHDGERWTASVMRQGRREHDPV